MCNSFKKINLTKSAAHWQIIDEKTFSGFIHREVHRLIKEFEENPDDKKFCGGEKKSKTHYTSIDVYEKLQKMSKKMNKPIAAIIDEFILVPLIIQ